jgi:hypothetical protein
MLDMPIIIFISTFSLYLIYFEYRKRLFSTDECFSNNYEKRLENCTGGISIDADSGSLGYVLWCCAVVVKVEKYLLFFRLATLAILWSWDLPTKSYWHHSQFMDCLLLLHSGSNVVEYKVIVEVCIIRQSKQNWWPYIA